ncbi:MAG: hypothetical protein HC915_16870 [Anaerolineae bacterium]|nr:hypothetical protein [Anaerolineae bacterium]
MAGQTLDEWAPDDLRATLLPNTLNIGEINRVLYGLPFLLEVQHLAYRADAVEEAPTSFESVQAAEARFLMPGLPRAGQRVNDVLLAQYVQTGGRLVDADGNPALDEDALTDVLRYYEAGVRSGLFSAELVTYDSADAYWGVFSQENIPLAVVNSTTFLRNRRNLPSVAPAFLPTADGNALVIADAWLWVLVTPNAENRMPPCASWNG